MSVSKQTRNEIREILVSCRSYETTLTESIEDVIELIEDDRDRLREARRKRSENKPKPASTPEGGSEAPEDAGE